jgi:Ca2+-binding EF-hand superfamily protein
MGLGSKGSNFSQIKLPGGTGGKGGGILKDSRGKMPASMSSTDLSKPSKMSGGGLFDDDEPIKKPSKSSKEMAEQKKLGEASNLARKYHLDLYEVKDVLKVFGEADDNGSGGLDKSEFEYVLRRMFEIPATQQVPQDMLNSAWKKMMTNAQGDIAEANVDTFLEWYVHNMFTPMVREVDQFNPVVQKQNETVALAKKFKTDIISIDKIKKKFDAFDIDGSGTIDFEEFYEMLKFCLKCKDKSDIAPDRAERFWKELDKDGGGDIDFGEFVGWFLKYFKPDDDEMDLNNSKGNNPVSTLYSSFNPMGKHVNGSVDNF